jgi:GH25 family lysozyme M1 (1,4-beta-N-acetylmuramidase)
MEVIPAKRPAIRTAIRARVVPSAILSLVITLVAPTVSAASTGTVGAGYAGSSMRASDPSRMVATSPPPGAVPGIDVSHWQGQIDWPKVAASGQRFVIAKATEGVNYIDPTYATNRAGAMAAGLVFGAYHFARPDLHPNNPIGEADHFVDVAQPSAGNVVPVLDLERSGTLTQAQLTQWILQWLGEVTARTGIRPMVYTSPNGWASRTGDTTAVADAGYTLLWVAHWFVLEPQLPANDWEGNGWAFWQYDDCGSVPGIQGCVDMDWYRSADFTPATVPSPDTVAPVASLATPTGVAGPVTVSFSEIVNGVTRTNVTLSGLGSGPVPSALGCWSKRAPVDCAVGNVITAVLTPIDPGEGYAAEVNPPGTTPVADRAGNPAIPVEQTFALPTEVEQGSPAVRYAWRSVGAPKAYGGSFAVERSTGATASFPFTGNSVTWYTATGPNQGKAVVSIDGRGRGTFDQFAPSWRVRVARTFNRLGPGRHTITIRVLGSSSSAATDTQVVVDAFGLASGVVKQPQLVVSWGRVRMSAASGGTVAIGDLRRSAALFSFWGSGVEWRTVLGPDQGRAALYLDGMLVRTVDNFAPRASFQVRSLTGLSVGLHQLRVEPLGTSRPRSGGAAVVIDSLTALP